MAGKILEMSEEEYHASPELNASLLADFADIEDKALLPRQNKQCFDFGHQYEDWIFQEISGDPWFDKKYSVIGLDTKEPPAVFELANSGVDLEKHLEENKSKYFTKKSDYEDLNSKMENSYNWIQERIKSGERKLISQFNFDMIKKMSHNFLDCMQIDLYADGSFYTVRELLEQAEFQKMVFWDGKRAMFDVFLIWDGTLFILDIKTAAEGQFFRMFKSKYGPIQCRHYTEGAESLIGQYGIERVHHKLFFLVAMKGAESKDLKYSTCIAESHSVKNECIDGLTEDYQDNVIKFYEWDEAGRPMKGYREHQEIFLYSKSER